MSREQERITIVVMGDAPNEPTGLARIARDITWRLLADADLLGIDLVQIGLNYDGTRWPWHVYGPWDHERWGAGDLTWVWKREVGEDRLGVLFTVWDPARCFELTRVGWPREGKHRWGYFAVDAASVGDRLGGPAAAALESYGRVLAYGRWASGILNRTTGKKISYLPHGIDPGWFTPRKLDDAGLNLAESDVLVGCVAANTARKDLSLYFQAVAIMREEWANQNQKGLVRPWLHIDKEVTGAWSVPQLAADYGFDDPVNGLILTQQMTDAQLGALYGRCSVTIAPGLGEGFGYPIVESLAAGTPVIHGDYAGGAELIPLRQWRPAAVGWRYEGPYNLRRPVYEAGDFAAAALEASSWRLAEPDVASAYCRGAVAHLQWQYLWPRWRSWFKQGLDEIRAAGQREQEERTSVTAHE